jgi:pimeloyl-ACP methyl ester carboxylesterase
MSAFTKSSVSISGFDLDTYDAGTGDVVIVFPGAGGPVISPALELLAERFRVVVLQLPGFGAQSNDAPDFDAVADQALAIIDALSIEKFHLLGVSFGGALALHFATLFPDRLVSLVLEAPAEQRIDGQHPSTMTPEQFGAAFRTHPEREPVFAPGPPEGGPERWQMIDRLMGDGTLSDEFQARLANCIVRTLILFGNDDGIIKPINGQIYRRHMRNSTLQYVYDAAHDIQCDRPEAFADVVGDFLTRGMVFMVNTDDGLINR